MMSSQAALNTGAYVSAPQAQIQNATSMQAVPQVLLWESSGAQPTGPGSPKNLPMARSNPQPIETLDERELKRLRRKQNNRESARRSRQRKADEITQLTDQITKRNSDVLLLQETVKVLAHHVKNLSRQVKEFGGSVDASIDVASDISHVIEQTTECHADAPQSTADVTEGGPRDPDEQEPAVTQAAPTDEVVPGVSCQSIETASQPATGT